MNAPHLIKQHGLEPTAQHLWERKPFIANLCREYWKSKNQDIRTVLQCILITYLIEDTAANPTDAKILTLRLLKLSEPGYN